MSEALCLLLRDAFPDSVHIRQIGAGGAPDSTVWQLAKDRGCLLVTKDEDFHRLSIHEHDKFDIGPAHRSRTGLSDA